MGDPHPEQVPGFLLEQDVVAASESESLSEDQTACTSKLFQCDGADTVSTNSDDLNSSSLTLDNSSYSSQDEYDATPVPAVLVPAPGQTAAGQPALTVDTTGREVQPLSLPLFLVLNARSIYNKISNFKRLLRVIAPFCVMISESWEIVGRTPLEAILNSTHYKVIS